MLLVVVGLLALGLGTRRWWRGEAPSQPFDVKVYLRGYEEAVVGDGGTLLPLTFQGSRNLSVCLQTPASTPTSQWRGRIQVRFKGSGGGDEALGDEALGDEALGDEGLGDEGPLEAIFVEPHLRLDTTLCFPAELPSDLPSTVDLELCGQVQDHFDGLTFPLPCQPLRYQEDGSQRSELSQELREQMRGEKTGGMEELLPAVDEIIARTRAAELPFLALRFELVGAYYLRQEGTPAALASARERLNALPAWLEQPEASVWAAQVAYEKALLALSDWDLQTAWQHLGRADRLCLQYLLPIRLAVRIKQAEILARLGALREAADRLSAALNGCLTLKCNPQLEPNAHGVLAWFLLLDPQANAQDLERAARSLEIALDGAPAAGDPLEQANQRINLAYLALRRGDDPQSELTSARELLATTGGETPRSHMLRGWAELVAGLAALEGGDPSRALELCRGARNLSFPRLTAWANSCIGQALGRLGDLDQAAEVLEEAILLLEYATAERFGQALTLGPGQRAEAFYRAAWIAVERGDPAAAWELLERLDHLTANQTALERCRIRSSAERTVQEELLQSLEALEGPASGQRRRQRESIRRSLREQLQELVRQQGDCVGAFEDGGDGALAFRAFTLDNEILLLHRQPDGHVVLDRRSSLNRRVLVPLLEKVAEEMNFRRLRAEAWRDLLSPLARALVPTDLEALEPVTTFALHGLLQNVPLSALPLEGETRQGAWLGEVTTVALVPSGLAPETMPPADTRPLFVVDPRGDLVGGSQLVETYRELFPSGGYLVGEEATAAAFRSALPQAGWLHIDAHGRFDAAFPELSSLILADGPMTLVELAELPAVLSFANLSGCRTGSWPVTADRGRFGIAGHFARRGARWVVASRSELDDRLAADFNLEFYQHLSAGKDIPEAHRQAMHEVRNTWPPSSWASMFLLQGMTK